MKAKLFLFLFSILLLVSGKDVQEDVGTTTQEKVQEFLEQNAIIEEVNIETITLGVSGMTCTGCEGHIQHAVNELPGVIEALASYEAATAIVKFDKTKSSLEEVKAAINSTGYKVKEDPPTAKTSK